MDFAARFDLNRFLCKVNETDEQEPGVAAFTELLKGFLASGGELPLKPVSAQSRFSFVAPFQLATSRVAIPAVRQGRHAGRDASALRELP
jgi:hypothetical protein